MTTPQLALAPSEFRSERRLPRLMVVGWAALFLNVMAFNSGAMLVRIPHITGQLLTQGALPVALLIALMLNPKGVLRTNGFLLLVTTLAVIAVMVSIHNQFMIGSTFRAVRFVEFVAVVWLLSPWFGRRDMLLLRCHRVCLFAVLGTVVLGVLVSPGLAFSFDGRLSGVVWPIPPTQVAHYAAVVFGTSVLLWACQVIDGRMAIVGIVLSGGILVGTHTRTAMIAMVVALVVAGASLFLGNSRVRRTTLWTSVVVLIVLGAFATEIKTWALRGQSTQEAAQLSGRKEVWSAVIHTPRPFSAELFGSGMSNLSFNGLAIDSNWVGTYLDMGVVGVTLDAALLIFLLILALTRQRGPQRAIALFLIVYCLFASITETGMSNPSPYLLDIAVAAASLLGAPPRGQWT